MSQLTGQFCVSSGDETQIKLKFLSPSGSPASSFTPAPLLPVSTSSYSSSDGEQLPPSSSLSHPEQRKRSRGWEQASRRKRRRKNHREEEEEENDGRFVGQMAVSLREEGGADEDVPLTLHSLNHRRRDNKGAGKSEKAVSILVRKNGYR